MIPRDPEIPARPAERGLPIGLRLIAGYKLATAALSLAMGFGLLRIFHGDVPAAAGSLIRGLRLDPQNHLVHAVLWRLTRVDRRQFEWFEAGTFVYALLHLVEGIGILGGRRWGAVLIVVATLSLIPIECYEIARRPTGLRTAALVLNTAIVIYLLRNRDRLRRGTLPCRRGAGPEVQRS